MLIAIDYDLTYTVDPQFWDSVIDAGRLHGHTFVCVTGRTEPPQPPARLMRDVPLVLAGNLYKRHAAALDGFIVDVWIDDDPEVIGPPRKVQWDDQVTPYPAPPLALERCPFCCGRARLSLGYRAWRVSCDSCGVATTEVAALRPEIAAQRWNLRDPIPGELR